MAAARVLVVEDDPRTRMLIVDIMASDGYQVHAVDRGAAAIADAESFRPHLALLDNGLPGGLDGRTVARRLREQGEVAVIFVTGADALDDERAGLDDGADDYVVKPFDAEVLSARVRAVLRRTGAGGPPRWEVGDLVVDEGTQRVTRAGAEIALTARDFEVLAYLIRRRGQLVTKEQLLADVWGPGHDGHVLEVHMSTLRQELETEGPRLIHTVRGVGYVFGAR